MLALFSRLYQRAGEIPRDFSSWLLGYFERFTLSDLLGWALLLGVVVFVFWRVRYRYMRSRFYRSRECPVCGTEVKRVRRKSSDRLLSKVTFLPFHRYRCPNQDCTWTGLRQPGRHHRKRKTDDEFEAAIRGQVHEDVS